MPTPLTNQSMLMCPHGGQVKILTTGKTKTASGGILAKATDPTVISGCPMALNGIPNACATVQWVIYNTSVLVEGKPSLDSSSVGMCKGSIFPTGPVIIMRP